MIIYRYTGGEILPCECWRRLNLNSRNSLKNSALQDRLPVVTVFPRQQVFQCQVLGILLSGAFGHVVVGLPIGHAVRWLGCCADMHVCGYAARRYVAGIISFTSYVTWHMGAGQMHGGSWWILRDEDGSRLLEFRECSVVAFHREIYLLAIP
ncbi:hypothetical protein HOY82DRAFT_274428 [Tuber indicum]|nr:hypothetical protein HOY82DRAFT_274428 [Tuber indicum]